MTNFNNNAFRSLQQFSLNTNNTNSNSLTPPNQPVTGTPVKKMWTQNPLAPASSNNNANSNSLDNFSHQGKTNQPTTYQPNQFGDAFQLQNGREEGEKRVSPTRVNAVLNSLHQQFPEASGRDFQKLVQERLKTKFIT